MSDGATPTLTLTDAPTPEEKTTLSDRLDAYNKEVTGYLDVQPLAVVARDPRSGAVVGGVLGRTSYGLLFVDIVNLDAGFRGGGLGSRMLAMVEEEGRRRGCRRGVLYTINFQAPRFYERHGWHVFGEIPCDPPGTSRVFMTKEL